MPRRRESATTADKEEERGDVRGPRSGSRLPTKLGRESRVRCGEVLVGFGGVRGASGVAGPDVLRLSFGVTGRRVLDGSSVGTTGAEVVACIGGGVWLVGFCCGVVGCMSAGEEAWIALRFAGPGVKL